MCIVNRTHGLVRLRQTDSADLKFEDKWHGVMIGAGLEFQCYLSVSVDTHTINKYGRDEMQTVFNWLILLVLHLKVV